MVKWRKLHYVVKFLSIVEVAVVVPAALEALVAVEEAAMVLAVAEGGLF